MSIFKRLKCPHNDLEFVRNVYGDEINALSDRRTVRSIWKCKNCGKVIYKNYLKK